MTWLQDVCLNTCILCKLLIVWILVYCASYWLFKYLYIVQVTDCLDTYILCKLLIVWILVYCASNWLFEYLNIVQVTDRLNTCILCKLHMYYVYCKIYCVQLKNFLKFRTSVNLKLLFVIHIWSNDRNKKKMF